jgi:VIT1/CCC1 family predicted Fe2+/Mn2+ transporter
MENNGANCESVSISLPRYQIEFLENKEKANPHKKKSTVLQEALDDLIKKEHRVSYDRLAFVFLFLLIGGTLAVFTFLLIPTLSAMFAIFIVISFISLIGGYVGIYLYYKEKQIRKWMS